MESGDGQMPLKEIPLREAFKNYLADLKYYFP
jgi:hypothetical protein